MEIINHFSHRHPLSLSEKKREDKVVCKACKEDCDGGVMIYSCRKCRGFILHESCAKLPQELHNPLLHPHPLSLHSLEDSMYGLVKCNACRKYCRGFTFRCDKCVNFKVDVKCALIRPAAIEEGEEEAEAVIVGTHHLSHPEHPLLLLKNIPARRIRCCECGRYCSDPKTYGCLPCGFFLHPSCFKLPQEIFHPFHPYHGPLTLKPIMDPLTLKRIKDDHVKCNACRRNYIYGYVDVNGIAYFCEECDFNLDVECALIRPAAIEEGEEEAEAVVVGTHHFTHHEHPLRVLQNIPANRVHCSVCGKYCSDPKTYGCLPCGFFLHRSCFKLFHPFHPYHPLTLKLIKDDDVKCNACRKDIYRDKYVGCFAYFCEHCINTKTSFWLDAECASVIRPAITYEGHDHLLQFNHNIRKTNRGDDERNCSACKSTCKSTCESYGFRCLDLHYDHSTRGPEYCSACKSTICEKSYGFRCLDLYCDFNLHLTCGPLPYTIQHKSHIHPLILTNCPIEDEKDCEPNEFYCYACEEERDPFLPIYYCNECPFVAGISCVISEVVSLLKGEHDGDVELRNVPFGQSGNLIRDKQEQRMIKALTLSDIFKSLSEAEKNELDGAFQRISWFLPTTTGSKTSISRDWKWPEINFKVDEAYTQFMKFVDIGIEIPIEFQDTKECVHSLNCILRYELPSKEEVVDIGDYKITRKLAPILKDLLSKCGNAIPRWCTLSPKVKLYFLHILCDCIYSMIQTKVVDITTNDLLNWWTILEISTLVDFRIQFASDHLKRVALAHFGLFAEKQGSKVLAQLAIDIEALKGKLEFITSVQSNLIEKCSRETSMRKGWKAGVGLYPLSSFSE